jgi:hypothetical protein
VVLWLPDEVKPVFKKRSDAKKVNKNNRRFSK